MVKSNVLSLWLVAYGLLFAGVAVHSEGFVTREEIKQYLQPDQVDGSIAHVEELIGHPLDNKDECVQRTLLAVDEETSDETFYDEVEEACGADVSSILGGKTAVVPREMDRVPKTAKLTTKPLGFGVVAVSTLQDTGRCDGPSRYFSIDPDNCYEFKPTDFVSSSSLTTFTLNPFPKGQIYKSFTLTCNNARSGIIGLTNETCGSSFTALATIRFTSTFSGCFETNTTSDENRVQGATNFRFTCGTTVCLPQAKATLGQCKSKMKFCNSRNIAMKYSGLSCKVKGKTTKSGCQCNSFCGHQCANACGHDSQCFWNGTSSSCMSKGSPPRNGVAIPVCTTGPISASAGSIPVETCFPGDSHVRTRNGSIVPMHSLRVGQEVEVADPVTGRKHFSPVIAFQHVERETMAMFLQLYMEDGKVMTLTEDHLVFSSFGGDAATDVPAGSLVAGKSLLWVSNSTSMIDASMKQVLVRKISRVIAKGIYAPLTDYGTVVVDGVLASCFTKYRHRVGYAVWTPYRWFRNMFPRNAVDDSHELDGVASFGLVMQSVAKALPLSVQSLFFA